MRISPSVAPAPVGLLPGDLELGLAVGLQQPALEVDDEQPARVQAPAAHDLRRVDREHARPRSRARRTPSSVTSQRPGRRPLRSRQAPSTRPSEKTIAAGPSQGSITEEL